MAGVFAEAALAAIEFHDALEQVAQHAITPLGHARVCALRPTDDRDWIAGELARVGAVAALLAEHEDAEPVGFPDAGSALERLALEGSVLDGAELALLGQLLAAARMAGAKLRRMARAHPVLAGVAAPPLPPEPEAAIARSVDPDGRVRDEASRDLARIRRELVETRAQIVAALERILASLDARQRGEAGVTMRNGRYVIPLRPGARQRTGGIVHDESATHSTIFVEPPETIELGNRLRAVEAEEAREVQRILRALTGELRPLRADLAASFEMLIAFDAIYARARHMAAVGAELPALGRAGGDPLALRGAAHPLLFVAGASVVRFDLVLEGAERTVLVSGPNTGGKTVLIKAVGLASALTQAGVPAPLGPGSTVPVFAHCHADIGDRQSIAESLSTFSAHVAAMKASWAPGPTRRRAPRSRRRSCARSRRAARPPSPPRTSERSRSSRPPRPASSTRRWRSTPRASRPRTGSPRASPAAPTAWPSRGGSASRRTSSRRPRCGSRRTSGSSTRRWRRRRPGRRPSITGRGSWRRWRRGSRWSARSWRRSARPPR